MGIRQELLNILQKIEKIAEQFVFIEPEYQWLAEAKFYINKVLEHVQSRY